MKYRFRRNLVRSRILILLVAALALALVAAGCGGGNNNSNNNGNKQQSSGQQSKKGKAPGGATTQAGQASEGQTVKGNVPGVKVLRGTVISSNPDKRVFVAKPTGGPPLPFEYTPKLNVKLDGKKASPQEIKQGQRITVRFLTKKGKNGREYNMARAMRLTSAGAAGGATGGTSG